MTTVLCVIGTRPEAIKMAPVVHALRRHPDLHPVVCSTGQHREMLESTLATFRIRPEIDLEVMRPDQTLAHVAAAVLEGIDRVLAELRPGCVLLQGDTATTTAAALAAFYRRIPVGHVEAGLRSGDLDAPWPEEANRRLAAVVTRFHFAPTQAARQNLLREGVPEAQITVTGNTVIDALVWMAQRIERDAPLKTELAAEFPFVEDAARRGRRLVLVTGHRRESFGEGLRNICAALAQLAAHKDVEIVYPVHLNPNVRGPVLSLLGGHASLRLIEPVDYRRFVYLMGHAHLILTDSGGVQEEAPALGKPVLVMRAVTERAEGVKAGAARLVGTDPERIVAEATRLLDDPTAYAQMSRPAFCYGDGKAAQRIVRVLEAAHCRNADAGA